tara:strand:+ start:83 stop:568 length:486 start_codon:yes stop_codon:yes gene_type:complete
MLHKILITTALTLTLPSVAIAACLPAELCTKVSGLTDVPLGTWGGSGDLTSNYTLCVYVQNDNESNYTVTGTGTGTGNEYIVTSGANEIPLNIDWEEDSDPGWTGLSENATTMFPNHNILDEDCAIGGNSAKVRVTIPQANMDYAISGSYSGTVSILTSPD